MGSFSGDGLPSTSKGPPRGMGFIVVGAPLTLLGAIYLYITLQNSCTEGFCPIVWPSPVAALALLAVGVLCLAYGVARLFIDIRQGSRFSPP